MDILTVAQKIRSILQNLPDAQADCSKIDDYIAQITSGTINVCAFGEFSSGKSSLLNGLIGYPLLPVADRPLTSKRIEITHAEKPRLSCTWRGTVSQGDKRAMRRVLSVAEDMCGDKLTSKARSRVTWGDGGTCLAYRPSEALVLRNFLWVYEEVQKDPRATERAKRRGGGGVLGRLVWPVGRMLGVQKIPTAEEIAALRIPSENLEKIEIGLPLPEDLRGACLTDIPGEGSVYAYGDASVRAAGTSQVVLHVLDAERIGSSLTEVMLAADRLNRATTVYVLNKRETLDKVGLDEALSLLRKNYQIEPVGVSALFENCACLLDNGLSSVKELTTNRKINFRAFLRLDQWNGDDLESNRDLFARHLHAEAGVSALRVRIATLLASSRQDLERLRREELLKLAQTYREKLAVRLGALEMPPQRVQLQTALDTLRAHCQAIEKFVAAAQTGIVGQLLEPVRTAVDALRGRFDVSLSQALAVSYEQFESDPSYAIDKSLASPVDLEIGPLVDTYFAQHRVRCGKFLADRGFVLPRRAFPKIVWETGSGFSDRVRKATCEILCPILADTREKPWFSSLRSEALKKYQRSKSAQCMDQWRLRITRVLDVEVARVGEVYGEAQRKSLQPLVRMKQKLEKEIPAQEQALVSLAAKIARSRPHQRLAGLHRDLTAQIENLQQEENSREY